MSYKMDSLDSVFDGTVEIVLETSDNEFCNSCLFYKPVDGELFDCEYIRRDEAGLLTGEDVEKFACVENKHWRLKEID